jgi:hypothetical protein
MVLSSADPSPMWASFYVAERFATATHAWISESQQAGSSTASVCAGSEHRCCSRYRERDVRDEHHVTGTLPVAQSHWGIKPYRGLTGALTGRDMVDIVVDGRLPVE